MIIDEEIVNNKKLDSIANNISKAITKFSKQYEKAKERKDEKAKTYKKYLKRLEMLEKDIRDLKDYNVENSRGNITGAQYDKFMEALKEVDRDTKLLLKKDCNWIVPTIAGAGATAALGHAATYGTKILKKQLDKDAGLMEKGLSWMSAAMPKGIPTTGAIALGGAATAIIAQIIKNAVSIKRTKELLASKNKRKFIKEESCFNY